MSRQSWYFDFPLDKLPLIVILTAKLRGPTRCKENKKVVQITISSISSTKSFTVCGPSETFCNRAHELDEIPAWSNYSAVWEPAHLHSPSGFSGLLALTFPHFYCIFAGNLWREEDGDEVGERQYGEFFGV